MLAILVCSNHSVIVIPHNIVVDAVHYIALRITDCMHGNDSPMHSTFSRNVNLQVTVFFPIIKLHLPMSYTIV